MRNRSAPGRISAVIVLHSPTVSPSIWYWSRPSTLIDTLRPVSRSSCRSVRFCRVSTCVVRRTQSRSSARRGDQHVEQPVVGAGVGDQLDLALQEPDVADHDHVGLAAERRAVVDPDGGLQRRVPGVLRRRHEVRGRCPRRVFSIGSVPSMITASIPMPAITAKWSAGPPSTLSATRSIALSSPSKATSQRGRLVQRDADVAGQQVAGPRRDQAERDAAAGQPGADHPDGAVAARAQDQVHALGVRPARSSPVPGRRCWSPATAACPSRGCVSSYSTCRRNVTQSVTLVGL